MSGSGMATMKHAEADTLPDNRKQHIEQLLHETAYALIADRPTLARLDVVQSIIETAELWRAELVDQARTHGASWTEIGQHTGTSKQAAQQRYGKKPEPSRSGLDAELPLT